MKCKALIAAIGAAFVILLGRFLHLDFEKGLKFLFQCLLFFGKVEIRLANRWMVDKDLFCCSAEKQIPPNISAESGTLYHL